MALVLNNGSKSTIAAVALVQPGTITIPSTNIPSGCKGFLFSFDRGDWSLLTFQTTLQLNIEVSTDNFQTSTEIGGFKIQCGPATDPTGAIVTTTNLPCYLPAPFNVQGAPANMKVQGSLVVTGPAVNVGMSVTPLTTPL